jgi:hypothetical protein
MGTHFTEVLMRSETVESEICLGSVLSLDYFLSRLMSTVRTMLNTIDVAMGK